MNIELEPALTEDMVWDIARWEAEKISNEIEWGDDSSINASVVRTMLANGEVEVWDLEHPVSFEVHVDDSYIYDSDMLYDNATEWVSTPVELLKCKAKQKYYALISEFTAELIVNDEPDS